MLYTNQTFRKLAGQEASTINGLKFSDLLTRGSAIFYETHFAPSLLLRGALDEISLELQHPDGTRLPIFVNAAHRPAVDGAPYQLHMTVFSAKQRKLYEAELLQAKREFEEVAEIVRRSADSIIRFSGSGEVESWNNGAQQLFGYTVEQSKGLMLWSLFPATSSEAISYDIQQLEKGQDVFRDALALHQSGELLHVSISLSPHLEAPGTVLPGTSVGVDTERFREEALAFLRDKLEEPAMHKVRWNEPLTTEDIESLEKMLVEAGIGTSAQT